MKKKEIDSMRKLHYARMKGFLTYDIECEDLTEQKIILEECIRACQDLLKKKISIQELENQ